LPSPVFAGFRQFTHVCNTLTWESTVTSASFASVGSADFVNSFFAMQTLGWEPAMAASYVLHGLTNLNKTLRPSGYYGTCKRFSSFHVILGTAIFSVPSGMLHVTLAALCNTCTINKATICLNNT
jgi:hypothetical protein